MGFLKGRHAIKKSKGKGRKAGMLGWRSTHLNQVIKTLHCSPETNTLLIGYLLLLFSL